MPKFDWRVGIDRRRLVKTGAALAAAQFASPFIVPARAADAVKIGLDNPLTGTYAGPGKNELVGCQMALDEINAKGGILGRPAELLVEDSSSGDAGTAVQKARKLIDSDKVDFLLGNVNSALALAMAQVSNEKGILHIVPGGHTDAITGSSCHWNVFRVCNTTQWRRTPSPARWSRIMARNTTTSRPTTPSVIRSRPAWSRRLRSSAARRVGGDLVPLGTVDFSSYLIKAQAANPDVIVFLVQGDDMLNALKQAVQFGLQNKVHLAGAQQEMEPLEGLPPEARDRHMGDGMVLEPARRAPCRGIRRSDEEANRPRADGAHLVRLCFDLDVRARGKGAKSLKAVDMAKALQDFHLPPEVALGPNPAFYRAGQNQLLASLFVGDAQAKGSVPDDLFKVTKVVNGADVAGTVEESGCKMTWPT